MFFGRFVAEPLGGSGVPAYMAFVADVINLRRARKAKARDAADAQAQANRIAHGRNKTEKKTTKAENDAATRRLDGHKRDGE